MNDILEPNIECAELSEDGSYGKYVVSPLERGYGITLGNALRRVLLSSISTMSSLLFPVSLRI